VHDEAIDIEMVNGKAQIYFSVSPAVSDDKGRAGHRQPAAGKSETW
jgi:hypothetical protein